MGEVCPLSRPVTQYRYPPHYRAAFAFSPLFCPPHRRSPYGFLPVAGSESDLPCSVRMTRWFRLILYTGSLVAHDEDP
jgi:hypothetical protein